MIAVEPGGFRTDFAGRSLTQSEAAISACDDTAGKRRKEHDRTHGTQPGDPAKAAQALITAVESETPPSFLLFGTDARKAATGVLEDQLRQVEQWAELTDSTDFDA